MSVLTTIDGGYLYFVNLRHMYIRDHCNKTIKTVSSIIRKKKDCFKKPFGSLGRQNSPNIGYGILEEKRRFQYQEKKINF